LRKKASKKATGFLPHLILAKGKKMEWRGLRRIQARTFEKKIQPRLEKKFD